MYNSQNESLARVVEPELVAWRTFSIGGVDAQTLLVQVREKDSTVDNLAERVMKNPKAFETREREEEINTIILTPASFGCTRVSTEAEILNPERLADWSRRNARRLPEGHVVDLLPVEAGPHIRHQYEDQPKGENLRIAMKRITASASSNYPYIFVVSRGKNGVRFLSVSWAGPTCQWNIGVQFVYWLRKVAI